MIICISSAHGKHVRGAAGELLDEVNASRELVELIANELRFRTTTALTFHDDTSTTQSANLKTIVNWHNSQTRDLDVSVHFNAFDGKAHGTETLYVTQRKLAKELTDAIASLGFTNRGPKYRDNLAFLNNTERPAVLLEICFCDNEEDCRRYAGSFFSIAALTASVIHKHLRREEPAIDAAYQQNIICTMFGGKGDPNNSAYAPYDAITDQELSCALPYRFAGPRPQVEVVSVETGKRVICDIRDIGPWNIDDPYWLTDSRPQAETGTDMKGRTTNGAGIDLTPAAAKAIGLDGMGTVHWRFTGPDAQASR
jgi:hypothetical protein